MIRKVSNIVRTLSGSGKSLQNRLMRFCLLAGAVMSALAIMENIIISATGIVIIQMLIVLAIMGISLFVVFWSDKVEVVAGIIIPLLVYLILPYAFFSCGGINGGASICLLVGIVFLFVIFSGRKLIVHLCIAICEDTLVYIMAARHPEWVTPLACGKAAIFDSYFSVMLSAVAIGSIIKFQTRIYRQEKIITNEQKKEIEEMAHGKENFFASMSHELRTPINSVIGLNELVLRQSKEENIREYALNVQNAGKMLLNLVNDILDFSQIQAQKMEIVEKEYVTKDLFQDIVDIMTIRMQEKNLEFRVVVDPEIPKQLIGDERRIQQVLLNLLTNACKYTEKGAVTIKAYSDVVGENRIKLTVSVEDTGVGIRKEEMENLFESFKRVKSKANQKIEGTGLGLAITRKLVLMMNGQIHVDSIYTKGSIFTVEIEQEVANPAPMGKVAFFTEKRSQWEQYVPCFKAPEARVLVVDDHKMNLVVIEKLLERTKVQIDFAESGGQCLEKTREKFYHVILIDNRMTDMDGVETLKAIRRQSSGLCRNSHCILSTAESEQVAVQICEEHGFSDYLLKPIVGTQLERMLVRFIPDEIVEQRVADTRNVLAEDAHVFVKRKKKVCITTDCVCDLPESIVKEMDIHVMYLYIQTKKGRFADTKELDTDGLARISFTDVKPVSASVEEYEDFFADMLMESERVIHISLSSFVGKSCGVSMKAAQCFDNVEVVDSGLVSGGQGLLVMYAAGLVQEGYSYEKILEKIEYMKKNVHCGFIMPEISTLYEYNFTNILQRKIFEKKYFHPFAMVSQGKVKVPAVLFGSMDKARKRFVRYQFLSRKKVEDKVVMISHAGCGVKEIEMVKKEIEKYVKFQRVIVQRASFSSTCKAGVGTIGISYFNKET